MMLRFARNRANVARWLNHARFIAAAPTVTSNNAVSTQSPLSPVDSLCPTSRCPSPMPKHDGVKTASCWTGETQTRGFHAALEQQETDEDAETVKRRLRTAHDYHRAMQHQFRLRSYLRILDLFEQMETRKVTMNRGVCNFVMKAYARLNNVDMVTRVFNQFLMAGKDPDRQLFNTLICAYTINGDMEAAFEAFHKMEKDHMIPGDPATYRALIAVCSKGGDVDRARKTFDEMIEKFEKRDVRGYNAMLNAYADNANSYTGEQYLQECRELIAMMKEEGIELRGHSYAPLIKLCGQTELVDEALEYFHEFISNDIGLTLSSFDAIVESMAKLELTDEEYVAHLLSCFRRMKELKLKPTDLTFNRILDLYEERGKLEMAFDLITKLNEEDMSCIGRSAEGFSAQIEIVYRLFERDVYSREETLMKLARLLHKLTVFGVSLTDHGYKKWFDICIKASDVGHAFQCWDVIAIGARQPSAEMAESMIRLLLDHHRVDDAVQLLEFMQMDKNIPPTESTYEAIMAYCAENNDTKTGKRICAYMKEAEMGPNEAIQGHLNVLQLV